MGVRGGTAEECHCGEDGKLNHCFTGIMFATWPFLRSTM